MLAIFDETEAGARARRAVGTRLKDTLTSEWQCLGVQLGYRYEDSPICIPTARRRRPTTCRDYVPTARPGSRAPHAWLPDGRSTLDLFGRGFVLLRFGARAMRGALEAAARAQRRAARGRTTSHRPRSPRFMAASWCCVRPDGHVAWRGDAVPPTPSRIIAVVRGAEAR